MNEVIEEKNIIEDMIYEFRGVQVIMDFDLARIYKCANGTKSINLAVKRHINRFPERYMFQLTNEEYNNLRFQIETSSMESEYGGRRYNPYAFTEQGVAMLATILHTPVAVDVSIKIMDAFVRMRHFIIENKDIYKSLNDINNKLIVHDEKLDYLFDKFNKRDKMFLMGEKYDAYSYFIEIFKEAEKQLIIIDSYADTTILNIIRKLGCKVILITKDSDRLNDFDVDKYNRQYNNLVIIRNNAFHDRYFIVDDKNIYQSGASINNAGNKIFSINIIGDELIKNTLLGYVHKIINK